LLQPFNGGEQFEYHKKSQQKTGQNHRRHIALQADDIGQGDCEIRENCDKRHTAPDDYPDREFIKSLAAFAFKETPDALVYHYE